MKVQQLQTWLVAMTLSGSVGIASCALDAGGDDGSRDVQLQEQGLYGHLCSNCTYWNGNVQGSTQPAAAVVPVCWSLTATQNKADPQGLIVDANGKYVPDPYRNQALPSSSPGFATIKGWVRQGVENSWARVANIKFTGWDTTCVSNGTADDMPLNPGKLILTLDSGFDYTAFDGKSSSTANKTYINATKPGQGSYEAYIIHEVGHALGFDHEAARPDNYPNNGSVPSTCLSPNLKSPGGEYLNFQPGGPTWVDVNSIMCYDNRPNKLSPGDIMGVQRLYGIHPAGSLVGFGARCAKIQGDSQTDGAALVAGDCATAWSSSWQSVTDQLVATPNGGTTKKSWTVANGVVSGTQPTPLVSWTYGPNINQVFQLANMKWRSLGDMCVTADGAYAGATLRIQPCDGRANQAWTFWDNNARIQLTGSLFCAAEARSPAMSGDAITLALCADTPTQNLNFSTAHQIRDTASQMCASVFGGLPFAGTRLMMGIGCNNSPAYQAAQFHLSGRITTQALAWTWVPQCAAWSGNLTADGTAAQVHVCDAAPAAQTLGDGSIWKPIDPQEWDLYWP